MFYVEILLKEGEYLFFVSVGCPIWCLFVNISSCLSKNKSCSTKFYHWVLKIVGIEVFCDGVLFNDFFIFF